MPSLIHQFCLRGSLFFRCRLFFRFWGWLYLLDVLFLVVVFAEAEAALSHGFKAIVCLAVTVACLPKFASFPLLIVNSAIALCSVGSLAILHLAAASMSWMLCINFNRLFGSLGCLFGRFGSSLFLYSSFWLCGIFLMRRFAHGDPPAFPLSVYLLVAMNGAGAS